MYNHSISHLWQVVRSLYETSCSRELCLRAFKFFKFQIFQRLEFYRPASSTQSSIPKTPPVFSVFFQFRETRLSIFDKFKTLQSFYKKTVSFESLSNFILEISKVQQCCQQVVGTLYVSHSVFLFYMYKKKKTTYA